VSKSADNTIALKMAGHKQPVNGHCQLVLYNGDVVDMIAIRVEDVCNLEVHSFCG